MTTLIIDFKENSILSSFSGIVKANPQTLRTLQRVIEKHLPKLDTAFPVNLTLTDRKISIAQLENIAEIHDFSSFQQISNTFSSLKLQGKVHLESGIHGIANPSGKHSHIVSALQLAYLLFPERLNAFLPQYQEITSSDDFSSDFLACDEPAKDPQEVLASIVDPSINPVVMTVKKARLSTQRMIRFYESESFINTLALPASASGDFTSLLAQAIKGPLDKETDTYLATEFFVAFPEHIPHLAIDLKSASQTLTADGTLRRKSIHNIPLELDAKDFGAAGVLALKGAILHVDGQYLTLVQKTDATTQQMQWFLINNSIVSPVDLDMVTRLLPSSTYLYYEQQTRIAKMPPTALVDCDENTLDALTSLHHDLDNIRKLGWPRVEKLSLLEKLSDAFHGCDAVSEIDCASHIDGLLAMHTKVFPKEPLPSKDLSFEEFTFVQKKIESKILDAFNSLLVTQQKIKEFEDIAKGLEARLSAPAPGLLTKIATLFSSQLGSQQTVEQELAAVKQQIETLRSKLRSMVERSY